MVKNKLNGNGAPIFFLSTGRCGTKWFSTFLSKQQKIEVFHSPVPLLEMESKIVYEEKFNKTDQSSGANSKKMEEIFLIGRERMMYFTHRANKRFVETNNKITFFAPIIADIIPNALFVHIIRHPGEFVRSGIRRKWYTGNHPSDPARIVPLKHHSVYDKWESLSEIRKISWLWNETNQYIESFKKTIPAERYYLFNFNEINENSVQSLMDYLKISYDTEQLKVQLHERINKQTKGLFPYYQHWTGEQKDELINQCENLANSYGFEL